MRIIALVIASLFATAPALAQTIRFYHHDAQGNLIAMTDDQAQVVWRAEPAPFADYTSHPAEHPQRFVDQPQEPHGLFEIGARWYDPRFGRFLTPDPMSFTGADLTNPQSLHRYAYALNNPYRFHDTSGEVPVETVLDVIDIVHSSYELWNDPSWTNGLFLVWSVGATFVPYVPGAWAAKGVKHGATAVDATARVVKVEKSVVGKVGSTTHIALEQADNGAYMVMLEEGTAYIGKGGTTRARDSARRVSRLRKSPVDSIAHWPEADDAAAFAKEAELIESVGGINASGLLNKINSPGKKF